MVVILLILVAGSLWAVYGAASFSLWLVFTVLGAILSIVMFILKHTFKLIAMICLVVLALTIIPMIIV